MITVTVTAAERQQGYLSEESLQIAAAAIQQDGYVVLADAVSHESIDRLRQKMSEDAQFLIARGRWNTVGNVTGHINQAPPPFAPYLFADIIANPFAAQVTEAVLGPGRFNRFYRCNTNVPGSGSQPLHWDGTEKSLIVNVGLENITEANGSIELWPGTHLLENFPESAIHTKEPVDNAISAEAREQRAQVKPPIRGNTAKGSLLIRHEEVWHRGMPNPSQEPRYMIAMMHYAKGTDVGSPMQFNQDCEAVFSDRTLHPNLQFVEGEIDYLGKQQSLSQRLRDGLYAASPTLYAKLVDLRKKTK